MAYTIFKMIKLLENNLNSIKINHFKLFENEKMRIK